MSVPLARTMKEYFQAAPSSSRQLVMCTQVCPFSAIVYNVELSSKAANVVYAGSALW